MTERLVAPFHLISRSGPRGLAERWSIRGSRAMYAAVERRRGNHSARLPLLVGRLLGRDGEIEFRLRCGGTLIVPDDDVYWLRHAIFEQAYEPEVDALLARVLTDRDAFLDCGANIGLWSVAAACIVADPARVIAVESSSRTFSRLERNWIANRRSFTLMHRALSDVGDDTVSFFASASDHASSSLIEDLAPVDSVVEHVRTVALGSLIDLVRARDDAPCTDRVVVVKLDVEGLEERLLRRLDVTLDHDVLAIYEDHGRERSHSTTSSLVNLGFRVGFVHEDGALSLIDHDSVRSLDDLKRDRGRGYNLVAVAPSGSAATRLGEAYPNAGFEG